MTGTPMRITLYNKDGDGKEFTRTFVPWRLFKNAVKTIQELDTKNLTDEMMDNLSALVVDAFDNQFSIQELKDGADLSEMIAVLNTIIAKARLNGNPTPPGK